MGLTSSLLDENKANIIKAWVQAELRNFALIYKKQYSLAFLAHVHDEWVQRKQEHTQLLKQRDPPQETEVVYQDTVLYFIINKKWKERFVVVRADYSLECHESLETFMKGTPPLYKLSTTGGTVLTTEEKYMEVVDRCFPDMDNVKEDFAPPVVGMPGQFPVYLRLPYQRDYYFCFLQEAKQAKFISVLSDCIRHQNQDFLKMKTYEVQAFVKAIQLYRQEKGNYEPWDMLIGNNVQVLANLFMEDLLPSLEQDLLPRLKTKKTERKRMWFATIEAAYNLVQETLTEGMAALNDECRQATTQQSALMRSDMDQIMSSRAFLESKLRATVAELATEYCKQHIEPRLPAVLEEMMGPISLGFAEARQVCESMMENVCQIYQEGMSVEGVQTALVEMSKPNLQSCYEKLSGLRDHIQEFSYPNCRGLEHSTQIDIQQLVDNVAYTFGLLLNKSSEDKSNLMDTMIKAKQRVLKQYDYDSSTQRKKIFQEALLSMTLPSVKAFLAPTFKQELPNFQQYIFDDYVNFINVENVYEDILQQILEADVSKVVKEAASMKKYNLFIESQFRYSISNMFSTGSLDYTGMGTNTGNASPSSPSPGQSLTENQGTGEEPAMAEKMVEQKVFMDQQEDTQPHTQPDLIKVCKGEDRVMADEMVEPKKIIQAHTQPELTKVSTGEHATMAGKMVEPDVEVQRTQAEPDLIKIPTCVEQKVEDNKALQMPGTEILARSKTPETLKVHTTRLEEMLVAAQRFEEKTHSGSLKNKETLVDQSRSSNPESQILKPAAHTLAEPIAKPVETKTNETPVQTSPPEGDTGSVDQVSQSQPSPRVSTESETESAAKIKISSAEETAPDVPISSGVQTAGEEDQNNNATEDTEVVVDDMTSPETPNYEVRCSNTADFSDSSSWTTEEEGDSIDEEDLTVETMTAEIPKPEDPIMVTCQALDVSTNNNNNSTDPSTEAVRPLDCIKEIRDLVVEVIEVEEVVQHSPDDDEVSVHTQ